MEWQKNLIVGDSPLIFGDFINKNLA